MFITNTVDKPVLLNKMKNVYAKKTISITKTAF